MSTLKDQTCSAHAWIGSALIVVATAFCIQALALADSDYDVTINTSSLSGTGATLTFDFIAATRRFRTFLSCECRQTADP
jgi:hypothetical protein